MNEREGEKGEKKTRNREMLRLSRGKRSLAGPVCIADTSGFACNPLLTPRSRVTLRGELTPLPPPQIRCDRLTKLLLPCALYWGSILRIKNRNHTKLCSALVVP